MTCFDFLLFRQNFPLLNISLTENENSSQSLVYFDNAATSQKPLAVIEAQQRFYQHSNANVHRSSHRLSGRATQAFERARVAVQHFIHAKSANEIIWTKGATESINLVAQSYARTHLQPQDEILLSISEHHANIVPWQIVAQQTGAVIKVLPIKENGVIDTSELDRWITEKTKIVACAHVSNVLGRKNPIEVIIAKAKEVGAITVIDGAQAIAHFPVDVQALGCDFYVFSAHKMYGPTGVGVLYGKQQLLENMPPYQAGGEMIKEVSFEQKTTFNSLPFKFEAGTPNVAGIVAFSAAIQFIEQHKHSGIYQYEQQLIDYCYQQLQQLPQVQFIVAEQADIPVIAFIVKGHHNQDIATALDSFGIAVRNGHHCAMPLMSYLAISGCLRISLAPYNSFAEIDYFILKLKSLINDDENYCTKNTLSEDSDSHNVEFQAVEQQQYSSDDILTLFANIKSWDTRHRQIMLLAKQLGPMEISERTEDRLISGCESLAWLAIQTNKQGVYFFSADSEAKVIRGLLVIVLAAFNGKTAKQIQSFDINAYFEQLGLLQHLSPSRGNGIKAIVEKILSSALS